MKTKYEIGNSVIVKIEGTIIDRDRFDKDIPYLIELNNGEKVWASEKSISPIDNNETYENGLNEMWTFMQYLSKMDEITYSSVFNVKDSESFFKKYSPKEALEEYKKYKERQEFHVGDEVILLLNRNIITRDIAIITGVEKSSTYDIFYLLFSDGTTDKVYDTRHLKKTGRFYDISEYLKNMNTYRENNIKEK